MNEFEMAIEAAIKKGKEEINNANGNGTNFSSASIKKARVQLAVAHLEQALRTLTENV